MPCDYNNYPANWKTEIRPAILKRAENKCESCGVPNHALGYRLPSGAFRELDHHEAAACASGEQFGPTVFTVVLTVAHYDHDTTNNDQSNLRAWCQRCHNRHDGPMRRRHAAATRRRHSNQTEFQLAEGG